MGLLNWLQRILGIKNRQEADGIKSAAFVHTWPIMDFAKKHGKMQIGAFPKQDNKGVLPAL